MSFLNALLRKREKWVEFETLYSVGRLERLRIFMAENHIPYKARAALLPFPLSGTVQSLWYVSVHPEDVCRVQHYLHTEKDW